MELVAYQFLLVKLLEAKDLQSDQVFKSEIPLPKKSLSNVRLKYLQKT